MNTGRFVAAAVGVWVVRVLLNWTFYTQVMGARFQEISAAHPGIFREVIPGFIVTDLVFALVFAYLLVKTGASFGGGAAGGAVLGVVVGILSAVVGNLYLFFGHTIYSGQLMTVDSLFQLVSHAIQGAVAGAIYKR